jgi:hypothetical protein
MCVTSARPARDLECTYAPLQDIAARSLRQPPAEQLSLSYPHLVAREADFDGRVEEYEQWCNTEVQLTADPAPFSDLQPDQQWLHFVQVSQRSARLCSCTAAPADSSPQCEAANH